MATQFLEGPIPKTRFGKRFKVPIYTAKDGRKEFIKTLYDYVVDLEEKIISHEELVSSVPKATIDPYKYTQQWKQHNLFDDVVGLGGEHLQRFEKIAEVDQLLKLVREHYLLYLADLNYPRIKAYIHGWANILRPGEWITPHSHIDGEEAYLAATYYLTTNSTNLYMHDASYTKTCGAVSTEAGKLVFFPSWVPHWSDKCEESGLRISLAFDIVTETTVQGNPWRPHVLLDDPATMPGLDGK
jgi:hypothetical protein